MSEHIKRGQLAKNFWRTTDLADMSKAEWEALCDGCGKCCLLKLEDEDSGDLAYTNIACRLFDDKTCSCGNYPLRKQMVAGCVVLTPENIERNAHWMPSTCAYRLLHEGKRLPPWHPLLTGDPASTAQSGNSVAGQTVPEYDVEEEDYEDYIVEGFQ
ncbi:YcgN family cysteine cluster protein [Neptunicoccus cionae]|uniref:YcgN family cysteine cluster protein n=1 Tax=Neptunicoccus cionae TaxID=2035344 RepID=UPI000C7620AF|nr:YcgN family cysteine cluster protein [Amylibacter cionae]PLS21872.1 YcgN family cysteine cluster protein [Amylibacter cionae]